MSASFYLWKRLKSQWLTSLLLVICIAIATAFLGMLIALTENQRAEIRNKENASHARTIRLIQAKDDFSQFRFGREPIWIVRLPLEKKKVLLNMQVLQEIKQESPAVINAYLKKIVSFPVSKREISNVMLAVSSGYIEALEHKMLAGTMPNKQEMNEKRKVIVLTEYAKKFHFKKEKAIGKHVFGHKVIGVFKPKKGDFVGDFAHDDFKYGAHGIIPMGSTHSKNQPRELFFVAAAGKTPEAKAQLQKAAQKRWNDQMNVIAENPQTQEYYQEFKKQSFVLSILGMGGVLVASLCALYLLLIRVMTRQRQLAIAKAIGATQWALARQVLSEVILLGLIGGLLGIGITYGLVQWLNQDIKTDYAPLKLGFELKSMGFLLLSVLGALLIFTLWPAKKAAKVEPAEVLRV